MYYPEGMKARVSPVQWSKPNSILAPLGIRTRAAGFKIISGDHYTTTAHLHMWRGLIWGKNSVEEKDVFKINGDDDDDYEEHKQWNTEQTIQVL